MNKAEEGDYFISPLSMQFLLGMILNGAQGMTASEICDVLGYGAGEVDAVNEYCRSMMEQLPELDSQTKLAIANAIVVNQNRSLLDSYKSTVSAFYDAEVASRDFSDNAGTTRYINQWCSDHTNGLITENSRYGSSLQSLRFTSGSTRAETCSCVMSRYLRTVLRSIPRIREICATVSFSEIKVLTLSHC